MPEMLGIVLVVSVLTFLVFAEFVTRHSERRYQTDVGDDGPNILIDARRIESVETSVDIDPDAGWKGWREMIVDSIQDESIDCRSFTMRPRDGDALPRFKGGQSILVRVPSATVETAMADSPRKPISRCYSLSSGPGETRFRITVKRVEGGRMSGALHDTVQVGDRLEIQSPRGRFHIDPNHLDRPLNLIAAGIGITPMLSMLLQTLEETPEREVNLFYQLRDQVNAPFLKPLRYLQQTLQGSRTFRLQVWFSRPELAESFHDDGDEVGRMNAAQIIAKSGHHHGDYRICGPTDFMASMAEGLISQGADEASVQYESFGGKGKGSGAIEVNDGSEANELALLPASDVAHKVRLVKSEISADWKTGADSLLDLAEEAGASIDWACRSGQCGACVRRLIRGEVKYEVQPECEFGADEVVMCVASAGSDLEIEA